MKKNLVSIIVNCFNGENYLLRTLNSILIQKYQNFEVIFVDNCSTDSTSKIFKSINDKRFKYFKTKKKINLYNARNYALQKCNGEFIAFLDSDDWWTKNFLSSRKSFFKSSKDYGFSYSNCYHYYEKNKKIKIFSRNNIPSGFILDKLLKFYFVKLSTIIIKSKIIKSYKFNSRYNIIGDYDSIIRISEKYKGMGFQNKFTYIRIHQHNYTHNNREVFFKEFKYWVNTQDYKKIYFKRNKFKILERLEYLKIINLLLNKKTLNIIFAILKYPSNYLKLKLIIIYFLPKFLIRLKIRYF
jgi:glycosyltransferase involved in cell wall biosynthesis